MHPISGVVDRWYMVVLLVSLFFTPFLCFAFEIMFYTACLFTKERKDEKEI